MVTQYCGLSLTSRPSMTQTLLHILRLMLTGHKYTSRAICAMSRASRSLTVVTHCAPLGFLYPSANQPSNNAFFLLRSSMKHCGVRCFPCAYLPKSCKNSHNFLLQMIHLNVVLSSESVYLNPAFWMIWFKRAICFFPQQIMALWLQQFFLPFRFPMSVHPYAIHAPTSFQYAVVKDVSLPSCMG